jgi:phage shock protein PspC (stress-responsive transcriptional regulator)
MGDKKIAGVCLWLAEKYNLNVTGLRIVFVASAFLGFGSSIVLYIVLWLIKPT